MNINNKSKRMKIIVKFSQRSNIIDLFQEIQKQSIKRLKKLKMIVENIIRALGLDNL